MGIIADENELYTYIYIVVWLFDSMREREEWVGKRETMESFGSDPAAMILLAKCRLDGEKRFIVKRSQFTLQSGGHTSANQATGISTRVGILRSFSRCDAAQSWPSSGFKVPIKG